jgi:hypothetical protein
MTEEHRKRVLEHQQIAQLFSCPLEELFSIYQNSKEDPDSTYLGMIYAIGRFRFGPTAWGDQHTEYFKQRARDNAAAGIHTGGQCRKREAAKQPISLSDLGL